MNDRNALWSEQTMALEEELETFSRLLHAELANELGRFALISKGTLLGVFDTYGDALTAGYKAVGLEPFLVKKVAAFELVAHFSRDLGSKCTVAV